MAEAKTTQQKVTKLVGLIFVIVAILAVARYSFRSSPQNVLVPQGSYRPHVICDKAFETDQHFENDPRHHISVVLQDGCFSGFVFLPRAWRTWHTQPVGDQTGYWVAYWFANQPEPSGPYQANSTWFNYTPPYTFRLQGHGTILFYENVPDEKHEAAVASPVEQEKPLPPPKGPVQEVKSNDMVVGFWPCLQTGTGILCRGYVRNDGQERKYYVFHPHGSRVIDDAGTEHKISDAHIAGKDCPQYCNEPVYPRAAALTLSVNVENIPASVKKITLVLMNNQGPKQFDLAVEEEKPRE
jgi:hypothetical protein